MSVLPALLPLFIYREVPFYRSFQLSRLTQTVELDNWQGEAQLQRQGQTYSNLGLAINPATDLVVLSLEIQQVNALPLGEYEWQLKLTNAELETGRYLKGPAFVLRR